MGLQFEIELGSIILINNNVIFVPTKPTSLSTKFINRLKHLRAMLYALFLLNY